jgi:protoporphyrinogen/coproporphyrinogen III oxidase
MADTYKIDVAVIGGGLTGLVTAFWLGKKGIDTAIIEKAGRTGGVIETHREEGFVYESGPNTGIASHPEVPELFDELAGLCEMEPADKRAKKRLIWKDGRWHPLPGGLKEAVHTPLFSTSDKFRLLLEPFRKKGTDPLESLEQMVRRRLGQSFLDYAVDPFISGIYAGDPAYLVPRYALPRLYALEQQYGSFITGAVAKTMKKKDEREKRVTGEVFSVRGGLSNLVSALESGIPQIYTGISQLVVTPFNHGYMMQGKKDARDIAFTPEFVISTVNPFELDELFPFINRGDLEILKKLEYARVIQVVMGFSRWKGMELNAFGGLVPSREKRDILGILFPSSFLEGRAPEGGALLSVFLGGYRHPEVWSMPDQKVTDIALKETGNMLCQDGIRPDLLKIFRYKHAIPQYGKTTRERLETIARLHSAHRGLILGGNINEGIGMADRIRQGKRIADHVAGAF